LASPARETHAAAAIAARISRSEAAAEMVGVLQSHVIAFEHLSEESHADIVKGLDRTLTRWARFLATGEMPPEGDFDPLREWTRARASEGVRLEDLLRSFGLIHQLGWQLLRRHARPDESEVLVDLAGLLAEYLQRVSTVVTETYLAERELLVSEEERRTRSLLDRLCVAEPLDAEERELADRLGVLTDRTYSPFAVVIPESPPHRHAALAARLRRAGWRLAVTHSDCVAGLTWTPLQLADLEEGPGVLLVIGEPTPRGELAAAREDVALLVEFGRRAGLVGRISTEDHLLEILLARSPRLSRRLRDKVLAPLEQDEHGELKRTLQVLVACRFDRTATSAALHIHRNTLAYRVGRIEEITGLDLGSPRDLACVYMALETGS
jgi:PucR C-terminal helix-turn-helix domain